MALVTHHADVLLLLGQKTDQRELQSVRVLILVHEDVAELVVVVRAHLRIFAEQANSFDQQIIEVERVVRAQAFLVELEDARDGGAFFVGILDARGITFGIKAAILRMADRALRLAWAKPLRVVAQILDARFDDAHGVVLIVDGERARVAFVERGDVAAQDADAQAVEGRDERRALHWIVAEQADDALTHLLRRLVRERDREDMKRLDLALRDQVRNTMHDDARLA